MLDQNPDRPDRPDYPDTPTSAIRASRGRIATPSRVLVACIPIVLMIITPFLPFAIEPTLWLGIPAVMWWMAFIVLLLAIIDRGINAQIAAENGTIASEDRA